MSVTHEPWLVVLSLIVAFQGSFVGLSLAVQVSGAVDPRRRFLLAGAALTLALAIWSMHFVGMLAAQLPVLVDFLVLPTLLSFLVCVLVVGIAVFAASNGRLTAIRLGLSALVMGAGICTMHYLGMYALHGSTRMIHDPTYVVASFLVAFNASGLALWLSFGAGKRPPVIFSAGVLALAISAMHYTAMAGVQLFPLQSAAGLGAPAVSPGTLAIFVACVAFLVSGLFLLTLVPDSGEAGAETDGAVAHTSASMASGEIGWESGERDPVTDAAVIQEAQAVKRPAAGLQAAPGRHSVSSSLRGALPIERDGQKGHIKAAEVVAVHADAHYTQLYDGSRSFFCPLTISELEQCLDPKVFNRVHRSHIANLSRVRSYRRSGDGGLLLMEGEEEHCVPVSRSRWPRVKTLLAQPAELAASVLSSDAAE